MKIRYKVSLVLSPIKMEKKSIIGRMRQLWIERQIVDMLLTDERNSLHSGVTIDKVADLYVQKYKSQEVESIKNGAGTNEYKLLEAQKILLPMAEIVDACVADGYIEQRKDEKVYLTPKGRKFVQTEYFIQAVAEQLGLGLSLIAGLGVGAGIRELVVFIWHLTQK